MKTKLLAILTASLLILGVAGPSAGAHELENDGNIGAVLHIEPDDYPQAGGDSQIILFFQDVTNHLDIRNCLCQLQLADSRHTPIAVQDLIATSNLASKNTYRFRSAGIYFLNVSGQPKPGSNFQAFNLNYHLVVGVGGNTKSNAQPSLIVGVIVLQVSLILVIFFMLTARRPKAKR